MPRSTLLVVGQFDENFLHVCLFRDGFEDSVAGSAEDRDGFALLVAELPVEILLVGGRQINDFVLQIELAVLFGLVHEVTADALASQRLPHNDGFNETRKWFGWNRSELEMGEDRPTFVFALDFVITC
jgi:hypothetical protein